MSLKIDHKNSKFNNTNSTPAHYSWRAPFSKDAVPEGVGGEHDVRENPLIAVPGGDGDVGPLGRQSGADLVREQRIAAERMTGTIIDKQEPASEWF